MTSLNIEKILLRELATFAATYGFQIQIRQLQEVSRRICEQISQVDISPRQNTLLTRKQCAELLRVSLPTLDRYIRQEGLPHRVKNPAAKKRIHFLFLRHEVIQWAESHLSGFGTRRSPK